MQLCRYAFVAACATVAAANNSLELVRDVALEDVPAGPRELHQRYSEIFRYGNRNAASHLWTTYILDRASVTPAAQIELLFSGFCAVSGSPVYPSDYKRYRLRLKHAVTGVDEVGFMYYCCWPRVAVCQITGGHADQNAFRTGASATRGTSSRSTRSQLLRPTARRCTALRSSATPA